MISQSGRMPSVGNGFLGIYVFCVIGEFPFRRRVYGSNGFLCFAILGVLVDLQVRTIPSVGIVSWVFAISAAFMGSLLTRRQWHHGVLLRFLSHVGVEFATNSVPNRIRYRISKLGPNSVRGSI